MAVVLGQGIVAAIEPQSGLTLGTVGPMAAEAFVRQDRPHVAVVLQPGLGSAVGTHSSDSPSTLPRANTAQNPGEAKHGSNSDHGAELPDRGVHRPRPSAPNGHHLRIACRGAEVGSGWRGCRGYFSGRRNPHHDAAPRADRTIRFWLNRLQSSGDRQKQRADRPR